MSEAKPRAWLVRRHDAPKYWIMFMHEPVDAMQDPEREVAPLYDRDTLDAAVAAAVAAETERCYEIVMRAPYEQEECDDDGPHIADSLKAMAFDITLQIRGRVKPEKPGTQKVLDFRPPAP